MPNTMKPLISRFVRSGRLFPNMMAMGTMSTHVSSERTIALGLVIPGQAEAQVLQGTDQQSAAPGFIGWNSLNILQPDYSQIGHREQLFLP